MPLGENQFPTMHSGLWIVQPTNGTEVNRTELLFACFATRPMLQNVTFLNLHSFPKTALSSRIKKFQGLTSMENKSLDVNLTRLHRRVFDGDERAKVLPNC